MWLYIASRSPEFISELSDTIINLLRFALCPIWYALWPVQVVFCRRTMCVVRFLVKINPSATTDIERLVGGKCSVTKSLVYHTCDDKLYSVNSCKVFFLGKSERKQPTAQMSHVSLHNTLTTIRIHSLIFFSPRTYSSIFRTELKTWLTRQDNIAALFNIIQHFNNSLSSKTSGRMRFTI